MKRKVSKVAGILAITSGALLAVAGLVVMVNSIYFLVILSGRNFDLFMPILVGLLVFSLVFYGVAFINIYLGMKLINKTQLNIQTKRFDNLLIKLMVINFIFMCIATFVLTIIALCAADEVQKPADEAVNTQPEPEPLPEEPPVKANKKEGKKVVHEVYKG